MKQKQEIDSDQEDAASDIAETARTRGNTADHILRDSLETDCDHNGEQDADGSPSMGLGYRKSGDDFFSHRPPGGDTGDYDADDEEPSSKRSPSPQLQAMRAKFNAERKNGPSRPLAVLAGKERELHTHSAAVAKLPASQQKLPDKNLLVHQLMNSVNLGAGGWRAQELNKEVFALYAALGSKDQVESILNRLLVSSMCQAMACHQRTNMTRNPKALETNLRFAEKFTRLTMDIINARENRHPPENIRIGTVNVETGGQAIGGNLENQIQSRDDREADGATEKPTAPRRGKR